MYSRFGFSRGVGICYFLEKGQRLTDKSYSGDNRLVPPESPYRRRSSAPRCRLNLSRGWKRSQGFGCSPIKKLRELGSDRQNESLISRITRRLSRVSGIE